MFSLSGIDIHGTSHGEIISHIPDSENRSDRSVIYGEEVQNFSQCFNLSKRYNQLQHLKMIKVMKFNISVQMDCLLLFPFSSLDLQFEGLTTIQKIYE